MLASISPRPQSVAEARAVSSLTAKVEAVANLLSNSNSNLWASVERLSGQAEECAGEGGAPRGRDGDFGVLEEAIDRAYREAERTSALVGHIARM